MFGNALKSGLYSSSGDFERVSDGMLTLTSRNSGTNASTDVWAQLMVFLTISTYNSAKFT